MLRLPSDPARDALVAGLPVLWLNRDLRTGGIDQLTTSLRKKDVDVAIRNWRDLAPLLARCFPELNETGGRITSKLVELVGLRSALKYDETLFGRIFIKEDSALPVAGSIKARGGIYEVFMFAWRLAIKHGLLAEGEGIIALAEEKARSFFARYTIVVGSTGNLGLSVGIAARALGLQAKVHMSSDAKQWKVERLRKLGADVVQHDGDYTSAVERAREEVDGDDLSYFVDDEHSADLFLGYSAAATELAEQLEQMAIEIGPKRPLFIYLPCGIGGAPGGTTFGAKAMFGDNVHCFFVQPVQSPCVIVQMMSGSPELISVYDVGLTNRTEADGMAVARMSGLVGEIMRPLLSGAFTVNDADLFRWLRLAWSTQSLKLEPSATAGFAGPEFLLRSEAGRTYLHDHKLESEMSNAIHVIWTTGGMFVPDGQFEDFLNVA